MKKRNSSSEVLINLFTLQIQLCYYRFHLLATGSSVFISFMKHQKPQVVNLLQHFRKQT